ncbi:endonuclease I family protein [Psychromonas ossibalaenae]|uniref:endonuclease I family protein n=1 Tax=Psychromonas ossibalaenae TaxID=444922 RepID=UPI00037BC441|nr:endonuclease [Psychromonas ossibalaenae]
MKKTIIALLAVTSFGAQAANIQAHDPHVVAPFSVLCKKVEPVDPTDPTDPNDYYAGTENLQGAELKAKLNQIISTGVTKLPYSSSEFDVWDALAVTDQDPDNENNVILMYTGRSQLITFSSSGNNDPDAWNREHTYPKSNGGFNDKSASGYTDIHHLRPTDASINNERGNLEFDNGGSATSESPDAGNKKTSTTFEPRDAVKGDVARMMFYMATRYEGHDLKTPDLELVSSVTDNSTAMGNVCTLLDWNIQDPVDTFESDRNDKIQKIQGNRNPYVDNPQWANEIFAKDCQ